MRCAVAADGEESPISLFVGFAGKFDGMAGPGRRNHVDLQPLLAQSSESWPGELGRTAATGGGVDDGKEWMPQRRFIPPKEVFVPDRAWFALQRQKRSGTVKLRKLLCKRVPLYLQRSRARKILVE